MRCFKKNDEKPEKICEKPHLNWEKNKQQVIQKIIKKNREKGINQMKKNSYKINFVWWPDIFRNNKMVFHLEFVWKNNHEKTN